MVDWNPDDRNGKRREKGLKKLKMDMVADLGATRLYRAPGESSHQ